MKPFAQPAFALVSSFLLMSGCASHPSTSASAPTNHDLSAKALGGASTESVAYKDALAHAFADLAQRAEPSRDIAAAGHKLDATQTKNFTVFVYPKSRELSDQRVGVEKPVHFGDETEYLVSVIGNGQCSTGTDLVPKASRPDCVTVEMRPAHGKPLRPHEKARDLVRVYMDADYHAYGISYHEFDPVTNAAKPARKKLKLNPAEPLSSEMLSIAREVAPLDLPVHASNSLKSKSGSIDLASEFTIQSLQKDRKSFAQTNASRNNHSCSGTNVRYKNTYGSHVHAAWCTNDPWPTAVETDRYVALLAP